MSAEQEFIAEFGTLEDKKDLARIRAKIYHSQHYEFFISKLRQIVCKDCDTVEATLTQEEFASWMQQDAEAKQRKIALQKITPKYRVNHSTQGEALIKISEGESDEQYERRLTELTKW